MRRALRIRQDGAESFSDASSTVVPQPRSSSLLPRTMIVDREVCSKLGGSDRPAMVRATQKSDTPLAGSRVVEVGSQGDGVSPGRARPNETMLR